jgi:hypothetical protein
MPGMLTILTEEGTESARKSLLGSLASMALTAVQDSSTYLGPGDPAIAGGHPGPSS